MINKSIDDLVDNRLSALKIDKEKMQNAILGTTQKRKGFKQWKLAAVAACLVVVLSLTALAAGFGYFEKFFGDNASVISEYTSVIDKSVKNNGIIFTVEEAYASERGGFMVVNFKKADETEFDEPLLPWFLDVNWNYVKAKDDQLYLRAEQVMLSNDRKTINALLRIMKANDQQRGRKLTVSVQTLTPEYQQGDIIYKGPWTIEITLPPDNIMKEFDLNQTIVKEDEKEATFLSAKMSPDLFIIAARGDLELMKTAMQYFKYEKKDGTVSQVNGSFHCINKMSDTEFELYFSLSQPMNINDIKSLIFIGKRAVIN